MTRKNAPRVLVAGCSEAEIAQLLPVARAIAAAQHASLTALGLIVLPADQSLSAGARATQQLRSRLVSMVEPEGRAVVRVTYDAAQEAREWVAAERGEILVVSATSSLGEPLLRETPCSLILVKGTLPKKVNRILVPIRGGPFAALALQTALALTEGNKGEITILQAAQPQLRNARERALFRHLQGLKEVTRWLRLQGEPVQAILDQARPRRHQLMVMGAAAATDSRELPMGAVTGQVVNKSKIPVLIVKTAKRLANAMLDGSTAPVDYTISVVVDKWFAENTFHAHEFEDIGQLVALKEKQGLTISLGLPTLNEQETIGSVIQTMRQRFVQDFPLLDEIVVIDSASTDNTVRIAQELGVPVVKHPDVLSNYGTWRGKGEALWNSLYVLKGDLIAWIDTDIANIHPRFVYGILGPLIREPHLMYVKGFYQRPLKLDGKLQARGGGRVTELTARPLLNLFYPELSGFVQPLAGEYAGRRVALEQVPFFVGYGVETGLLIDIWTRFGLHAMGQVDLEERVHRNQSLSALSKMAFEITQVVMQRVGEARALELVDPMNRSMKLIRYEDRDFDLEVADIQVRERPPMIAIPEYRALRGNA